MRNTAIVNLTTGITHEVAKDLVAVIPSYRSTSISHVWIKMPREIAREGDVLKVYGLYLRVTNPPGSDLSYVMGSVIENPLDVIDAMGDK